MKLTALVIISASIILTSHYLTVLRKRKLEYIKTVSEFFSEFSYLVALRELDAAGCIRRLSALPQFSGLKFTEKINEQWYPGCNFREIWLNAVNEDADIFRGNAEVTRLLSSFGDAFSKCSFGEFSDKCRKYSLRAQEIYDRENEVWEKNRGLQSGLGVFTAAAVFIIFI